MKTKLIALTLAATLLAAPAAYAHGGQHGAHHAQQQNCAESSYTCHGTPAHQHADGVCPYADSMAANGEVTHEGNCAVYLEDSATVKNVIRHCQNIFYMPMEDHCARALEAAALPLE